MAFIYDLADTWNDGATTFNGIRLNVTDTASAAGSRLMDLRVGGVSRLSVDKLGNAVFGDTSTFANGLGIGVQSINVGNGASVSTTFAGGQINVWNSNINVASVNSSGFAMRSTSSVAWGSGGSTSSADLRLERDAANTLALRNGVNAQAFRVYNTFTDASNGEWAAMRWSNNDLILGVQANGTGSTNRQMHYQGSAHRFFVGSGATAPSWSINADGSLTYVGTASGFIGLVEQTAPAAPATNGVRIYAEDDGAGKTRLMARFATGAAVQIAIEP